MRFVLLYLPVGQPSYRWFAFYSITGTKTRLGKSREMRFVRALLMVNVGNGVTAATGLVIN